MKSKKFTKCKHGGRSIFDRRYVNQGFLCKQRLTGKNNQQQNCLLLGYHKRDYVQSIKSNLKCIHISNNKYSI